MSGFPRHLVAFLFATVAVFAPLAEGQVVISEFMAVNTNTNIVDEDGSHSDWIELHNTGASPVSLNGWYLKDDSQQWRFPVTTPAVTLAVGARLVVWASDKNRKAAANRLHTNFKLASEGEYLALIRPDGVTVEHGYIPGYPPQATDTSYGISGGRQWNVLAGPTLNTQWKVRVPQTDADFTALAGWNTATAFDTSLWATKGTTVSGGVPKGIGYDSGGTGGARAFLINYSGSPNGIVNDGTSVSSAGGFGMYAPSDPTPPTGAPTLLMRTTFSVADPTTIQQLRLNIRYDDGFAVFLNGNEVLRFNAPTPSLWDSAANVDREDDQSETYETVTLAGAQTYLATGLNLLAIHGLNEAKNSAHFVITPSLEGFQTVTGGTTGQPGYLHTATPGAENTVASTTIGPDISQTTKNPAQPPGGAGSPPLLVTARLKATLNPVSTVTCRYAINFGGEVALPMNDSGTGGDAVAGDGRYSAQVPTTSLLPGQMVRWRIVATDNAANQSTDPPYRDPFDNEQYFGTIAHTPTIQTQFPVVYWFHNSATNPVWATNEAGFRSSFFYKLPGESSGRFYDNVRVNLHGQSTAGFGKKSQNLNFNADNRFLWRNGEKEIHRLNFLSNWADKSHVRNSLVWETWNLTKHPSHWCQTVRIQQVNASNVNAGVDNQFLCLSDMVEDGDEEYLERWGLDPNGALYKCYNNLDNTLQNSATQNGGIEKKTREWENFSDIQALVTAMNSVNSVSARRQWLYDNVDVPGLINFLAVHNLMHSHDYGHKNYYMYRDTLGTGEWLTLPWDQDLSFGHRWTSAQNYFDDDIESAGSIFLGGGGNWLMRMVNTSGATELTQMYVRRLRTLMDQFYGPPATPVSHFVDRINNYLDLLDPPGWPVTTDAERDFQKWGFWVDGSSTPIVYTNAQAVHHRIRPSATRIKDTNSTLTTGGPYPGANPYTAYGSTPNLHSSLNPFIPGKRAYLYNQISGATPTVNGQGIPTAQAATPPLVLENFNVNPGAVGQDREFFVIRNPSSVAVDISGWMLVGDVEHTFRSGTVVPAQGTATSDGASGSYVNQLIVTRKAQGFRARTSSPKALEYRHVQGGYDGQLSARGGNVQLLNATGALIASQNYTGTPTAAQNTLRVTELNYGPAAPTAAELTALPGVQAGDFEFIELVNTGATALTLAGASFDKGLTFAFPAGFTLAAGARTVVVANQLAFTLRYGSGHNIAGVFEGNLDNAGERIRLLDPVGEVVLDFTYSPIWYPPATAGGYSLVTRTDAPVWNGYNAATAWALSAPTGGTPGVSDNGSFSQVYIGWLHDHFTPAEQQSGVYVDVNSDPDFDLTKNFDEYAFAKNPRVADGPINLERSFVTVGPDTYFAVTFKRPKGAVDLAWTVEASNSPEGFAPVNLPPHASTNLGNGVEQVTYRDSVPANLGPRFMRVRATKTQ